MCKRPLFVIYTVVLLWCMLCVNIYWHQEGYMIFDQISPAAFNTGLIVSVGKQPEIGVCYLYAYHTYVGLRRIRVLDTLHTLLQLLFLESKLVALMFF